MISRLTAIATTFAILATASLAYATSNDRTDAPLQPAAKPMRVVHLPTVVVVVKRSLAQAE